MENTKVILITGATDGLGKGVARALIKEGYVLLLHGRNPDKGKALVHELKTVSNNANIYYFNSDFSKLDEVVTMAKAIQKQFPNIDVLINNAGIGCGARTKTNCEITAEGYEKVFTINYLAHILLTTMLLQNITRQTGRIINVSSIGQTNIDFTDIMIEKNYQNSRAYCQSKTAQIMYTLSLAEQLTKDGITVNALHPSTYMNTKMTITHFREPVTSVTEGVEALLQLAVSEVRANTTGAYFDVLQPAVAIAQVYNKQAREQLLAITKQLLAPFL